MPTDKTRARRDPDGRRLTAGELAGRPRRRRTRIAVISAAVAVSLAVPLALGRAAPAAAGPDPEATSGSFVPGPTTAPNPVPGPQWTVTVNGKSHGVPQRLATGPTDEPQFDVAPGQTVTIVAVVTMPGPAVVTKFFLGISGETLGAGPHGPIGLVPVLAAVAQLAPGPHKFTVRWTVPRGPAPQLGYQLALAAFYPRSATGEPAAEGIPMIDFGIRPGY